MEGQQDIPLRRLLHRRAAQARICQIDAVVGQAGGSRRLQGGKVGQFLPFEPLGHRACLQYLDRAVLCLIGHIADDLGRIAGRQGIRHADHGRVAACRRCRRSGQHILLLRLSRVAEVHMPVHKAGRHRQSGGVIYRAARRLIQLRTQLPDHAVIPDQDIHLCVDVGIRVKYPSVSDQKHVCFPSLFPRYVYSQSSSIWICGMPSSRNSSDTCRKPAFSYSPRA